MYQGRYFEESSWRLGVFHPVICPLGSLQIALTKKTLQVCISNAPDGTCSFQKFPSGFLFVPKVFDRKVKELFEGNKDIAIRIDWGWGRGQQSVKKWGMAKEI